MAKSVRKKKRIYSSEELLSELRKNRNFQCSLVYYLADILEDYFSDRITEEELVDIYRRETVKAQFIFSHMPSSEIENNKRIFQKEFAFADSVTSVIVSAGEADVYSALRRCIEDYLFS